MSIQAGIQELLRRLTTLEAWRKQAPSFGWGYVVQTDPLQVRREFDDDPLPGKPGSAGGTHTVGDRVLLLEQGSRVTVMTSKPPTLTQSGIGKIAGTNAANIVGSVVFPKQFDSIPVIHVDYIGSRASGNFNPEELVDFAPPVIGKGYAPSKSGLSVAIHRTDGANFTTGWDHYYAWTAIAPT